VHATGDIGAFLIVSEGAVSSGVRRIEALTGEGAIREIQAKTDNLKTIASLLKTTPEQLITRVEHVIKEQKEQEREIESLKSKLASRQSEELIGTARDVNGIKVISQEIAVHTPRDLREFGDHLKEKLGSGIIVLGARGDGKVFLLCRVTPDLTERFHAGRIISKLSILVGGKGGGRRDMAEGGGPKASAFQDAISKAYDVIEEMEGLRA
jgi:alanyl-tRNA synthetase